MNIIQLSPKKSTDKNGKAPVNAPGRNLILANNPQMEEEIEALFNHPSEFFLMKVHTDILTASGINVDDMVVIDPSGTPLNGQVVIFRLDNELMIRKYQKHHNRLTFYGENEKISPLQIEPGYAQFSIVGVVKYIIRSVG